MTVSVIIPAGGEDIAGAHRVASRVINAYETIIETGGESPAQARNIGRSKATGDYLLFIDADMEIPVLYMDELESYGYEMATALYLSDYDPLIASVQRALAFMGHPFSYFGGFMWMHSSVFDQLGGFRDRIPLEDVEFAQRAWSLGHKIGYFNFYVKHTRPFKWKNAIGPLVTEEGIWGIPKVQRWT